MVISEVTAFEDREKVAFPSFHEKVKVLGGFPETGNRVPKLNVVVKPSKDTETFPPIEGVNVPCDEVICRPRRPTAKLEAKFPEEAEKLKPFKLTVTELVGLRVPKSAVKERPTKGIWKVGTSTPKALEMDCPLNPTEVPGTKFPCEKVDDLPSNPTSKLGAKFPTENEEAKPVRATDTVKAGVKIPPEKVEDTPVSATWVAGDKTPKLKVEDSPVKATEILLVVPKNSLITKEEVASPSFVFTNCWPLN